MRLNVGERWFVVYSLMCREEMARCHLQRQGFRAFLPRRMKTRRHARKIENVLSPFFPRYLFLILDLSRDRWRSVNGTFGVSSLLMEGKLPRPAPRGIVEALVDACDERDILRLDGEGRLQVGDRVQLLAGPFAEQMGRLERLDNQGRVRVLLEIMGGRVPVDVQSDIVAKQRVRIPM